MPPSRPSPSIDFSVERFYGMPNISEIAPAAEIAAWASDFRDDVELAWCKESAYPDTQELASRYSPEGQCAVTMHLFLATLKERWPNLDARNMIGSVVDEKGNPYTDNHVWTEIKTDDDRTVIVDLTPNQTEGLGKQAPAKIIGYADDLAQKGYAYTARYANNDPDHNPSLAPRYDILRKRYNHIVENRDFYHELSAQSIFIVGGVAAGKTELAKNLEAVLPHKHAVDVGNLFRVAAKAILEEAEASPQFIDNELLEGVLANDAQTIDTFVGLLSRKTALLRKALTSTELVKNDGTHRLTQNGEDIEDTLMTGVIESIVPHVAKAPNARRVVWDWINNHASDKGGLILTGHSLVDIDTTKYTVVPLEVSPEVAAQRALQRSREAYGSLEDAERTIEERNTRDGLRVTEGILKYLGVEGIDTTNLTEAEVSFAALRRILVHTRRTVEQRARQEETAIPREEFNWEVNGLVAGIRAAGADIYSSIIAQERERDPEHAPTEFDLSVQTMMQLCGHEPSEVWQGNGALVADIVSLVSAGKPAEANRRLSEALLSGSLRLNEALVHEVALGQVERLRNFSAALYSDRFHLPSFSDPGTSPFEHPNAEISSKKREVITLPNGEREMRIYERHSGKAATLKRVSPEISEAYAKGFHYLHAGRPDEYKAFGAFADGEEFPFAWVSYSPVDRAYKKEMIQHFGIEPHRMLEMTRAWNASWSPKNTMSLLFSFAHSELQQEWQRAVDNQERDKPLAGIVTAINPNLGFRANAFNGVDFGVIGLKPAGFTYLLDENGRASYMPRRAIAKTLGIPESELESHPRFTRNKLPLMPTNEMAVLFKGTSRYQIQAPIYKIPDDAYKAIG